MNGTRTGLGYLVIAVVLTGSLAFAAGPDGQPPATGLQASGRTAPPKPGTGNFIERLIRRWATKETVHV